MPFVPIEKLTKIIENKYEAVLVAAKEARVQNSIAQLKDLDPNEVYTKITTVALENLIGEKVKFFYGEEERSDVVEEQEILDIDDESKDE